MKGPLVELTVDADNDVIVGRLEGEIDGSNAIEVRGALLERVPNTALGLVVDLSAITYLDSSGIHLVFELASRLRNRRQAMRLIVPDGAPIARVLELCDVASVVQIDSDLEGAAARLRAAENGS